ncbi:MAG: HAMP domain-containing histidine kinase [Gammaproteobacteria bacterium]|nr:HAMP domain-containing histidine kinase [Gammaproteobacteria bacterium]
MFITKLTITISALLAIILLLAATLYWGTQRAEYYFQRIKLTHDTTQAYVQVSHDAYRHFKELVDTVVLDGDDSDEQSRRSYQALHQSIKQLQITSSAEINYVDEDEKPLEIYELAQISTIEKLLAEGFWAFGRVMLLKQHGSEEAAKEVLNTVLEDTIDQQFKPIIDAAIADELEEVEKARQHAQKLLNDLKLIASVTTIVAFILALTMTLWLWRNLSTPLNQLVNGVRQVTKGDLSHRIQLLGRNEFTYLAKNFNDMTHQLAQQKQHLLTQQFELENKVDVRTNELQQANQKLKQVDEGRKNFFADISHELRTPLTAIKGEAEISARGKNKTVNEYIDTLKRIIELSNQLGKLVEDLLFMARSENSNMHFEFRTIVLNNLVSDLCKDAQVLVQKKQLQLNFDITQQKINIYGERLRLRQLLLILIDNACCYSDPGGEITITLREEKGYAILVVSDQGIGIDSSELNAVFERFYRSDQARKKVISGTGLGLPLAKSIVKAHQSRIELVSELGKGTDVTITFPVMT